MRLIRARDYDDMSLKAANIIAAQVSLNPKSVLGLATGSTPIGTYRHLVEWYQKGELDFGKAVSINLDEYCGLSGEHPQSYRRFMRENLFNHINIPADRSFLPDGTQTDSALECAQYDRIIEEHNGIDSVKVRRAVVDSTGRGASVFLMLHYGDKSVEQVIVPLVKRDSIWYMR